MRSFGKGKEEEIDGSGVFVSKEVRIKIGLARICYKNVDIVLIDDVLK